MGCGARLLGVAVALVAFSFGSSASADHCTGRCGGDIPFHLRLARQEIGRDQVLVVEVLDYHEEDVSDGWWETVHLEVLDSQGIEIEGSLEHQDGFGPAAWRPSTPWQPGTFNVLIVADLANTPVPAQSCSQIQDSTQVRVVDELRHTVAPWELVIDERFEKTPVFSLSTIVCCDGAMPQTPSQPGAPCGPPPIEIDGYCTELLELGSVAVETQLRQDGAGDRFFAIREISVPVKPAGAGTAMEVVLTEPSCLVFEVLDLVTGRSDQFASCHGEGREDELGQLDLFPIDAVNENCSSLAYTCESNNEGWREDACEPWPPGASAPDEGCGCATSGRGAVVMSLFLPVLAFLRRRAHRPGCGRNWRPSRM